MSELRAFDITLAEEGYCTGVVKYRKACYDKSEADKVIAEKDKQIDLYKRGWEESDRINEHLYAQLRHSNHNRCLAMVKYCELREDEFGGEFAKRWLKIWLALAEEPTWAKFLLLIHPEEKL